jgi:predicted nucleic acid-binding protein
LITAELATVGQNSQNQDPAFSVVPPRIRTDVYLAAMAIAHGWRLVSFDRDFVRFEGLERLVLP